MTSTRTAAEAVDALFAPPPGIAAHPAVVAAERIAREHLAPHAAEADDPTRGVDPEHLALLARSGMQSTTMPVAEGGHGAPQRVDAEVVELLSGACGATWFLTTQHRFPQQLARGPLTGLDPSSVTLGPAADTHRAALAAARERAGIAIAHGGQARPPCAPSPTAPVGGSAARPTGAPAGACSTSS